jgi:hypothetical protein
LNSPFPTTKAATNDSVFSASNANERSTVRHTLPHPRRKLPHFQSCISRRHFDFALRRKNL